MTGGTDVGGAAGIYTANSVYNATVHGKGGGKMSYDGMLTNNLGDQRRHVVRPESGDGARKRWCEVGGISAESDSVGISHEPGAEGRRQHLPVQRRRHYTNENLQSDNFTDELRARGLTDDEQSPAPLRRQRDAGRPDQAGSALVLRRDAVSGNQNQVAGIYFNKTQGTPFYTPDLDEPAYRKEWLKSIGGRLTWQAAQKHKVNVFADVQSYQVRGSGRQ